MHTWYVLDQNDRISSVGGAWDEFAKQNGAEDAVSSSVIGRSVWDFIKGEETGSMFRSVLFTCRATGESLTLNSDCSDESCQRTMRMRIKKQSDDGVRIEHDLVVMEKLVTA